MTGQKELVLAQERQAVPFLVEPSAWEGVRKIADLVAQDVEKVSGVCPVIAQSLEELTAGVFLSDKEKENMGRSLVLCATLGRSPLMDSLIKKGLFSVAGMEGKREVYQIRRLKRPFDGIEEALIICGSDKRGTIYGMFSLSEYIGVSPLCYWGDAEPMRREKIVIGTDLEGLSKEPSVRYRGFFINDEWPCFGNWTFSHFGGFNAEMYEHVFELLLRLKGNYLWPAMWTSSFALDGPGSLNEELADLYGVVIGNSHHEPCLRASEEWDKVRGPESPYGNEWNFYTNREGLIQYWEDSLKRSGKYEHLITIGMRGERDSSMLGEDASLEQNIDLLKDIITVQKELIRKHVNADIMQTPLLLALYKEVEAYFYGDEQTGGLKDWDGLEGVICMLCEDNYGQMRTLPTPELIQKIHQQKGGFGMYYHFDYHGSPISYEWMPSTPFSKIWEQMCMAYDYGVRDVWIVNVGDLKGNEVALAYFMTLAYDFLTWGSSVFGSWKHYTRQWLEQTFPDIQAEIRVKLESVFTGFTELNGMRRPEALHAGVYHPCHYLETDRMLKWAAQLEQWNEEVYMDLSGEGKSSETGLYPGEIADERRLECGSKNTVENIQRCRDACYSMIYYPAKASINLLRMHLYAGLNAHYAAQGRTIANVYADEVTKCIAQDKKFSEEFAAFLAGKWKGMELEQHIGFVKWNEDNCRYPVRMQVEPAYKPRMSVSRKDREEIAVKNYGGPMTVTVEDFLYEGCTEVVLEVANDGIGTLNYRITAEGMKISQNIGTVCGWLTVTPVSGQTQMLQEIVLTCDRSMLQKEKQEIRLLISDGETQVAVLVSGKAVDTKDLLPMTFMEQNGVIAMEACHYADKKEAASGAFQILEGYGRSGWGAKVFPSTADFTVQEEKPSLTYRYMIPETGNYTVECYLAPTNSVRAKRPLRLLLNCGDGEDRIVEVLSSEFRAGDWNDADWCRGVLDQVRISRTLFRMEEGQNTLTVSALEAGLVLERILIYPSERPLLPSYLGPQETWYKMPEEESQAI